MDNALQSISTNQAFVVPKTKQKFYDETKNLITKDNILKIISCDESIDKDLSVFNTKILEKAKLSDTPDISTYLREIKNGVKEVDPKLISSSPGILSKIFGRAKSGIEKYKEKFTTVNERFVQIENNLRKDSEKLKKSFSDVDSLAKINVNQFIDLNVIIVAFEDRIKELRDTDLPLLEEDAKSGDQSKVQELTQFKSFLHTVEKKHSDLVRRRLSCIHTAIIVTNMKNNVVNTILTNSSLISSGMEEWKKQVVLQLENESTKKIAQNQNQILDFANEMTRKNADLLKETSILTTTLAERSNIDYETLEYVNTSLIETVNTVSGIIKDAEKIRSEELIKINQLEETLKQSIR